MKRIAIKLQCYSKLNPRYSTVRFNSRLFVSRLSFYTTDDEFRQLFSPFGQLNQASLVMDPQTGRTKGFGFVTFKNETDAQNAVKALNERGLVRSSCRRGCPHIVKGRLIFVEFANKEKD